MRRSLLLMCTVVLAACTGGAKSHVKTAGSTSRSNDAVVGRLVVFVPEARTRVHASTVSLSTTAMQIGQVSAIKAVARFEAKLSIALTVPTAMHTDASAIVCDNRIRVDPGSLRAPVNRDSVIALARTTIRPGSC